MRTGAPIDMTATSNLRRRFARWALATWPWLGLAGALTACSFDRHQLKQLETDAEVRKLPAFQARLAQAEALFKKRCETAGEFIYKTIPDVKGIVWMKWRPTDINLSDQFRLDDPFGRDCGGEECFKELLVATDGAELRFKGEPWGHGNAGYEFIESVDPADGKLYRYRLRLYHPHDRDPKWHPSAVRSELVKDAVAAITAPFGVTWDDLSTREDRENWIAGGSLTVVDLKTNEAVAKRVGYMMDRALGSTAGFRSPWGLDTHDNSCPPKLDESGKKTMVGFTRRILFAALQRPKGEIK